MPRLRVITIITTIFFMVIGHGIGPYRSAVILSNALRNRLVDLVGMTNVFVIEFGDLLII